MPAGASVPVGGPSRAADDWPQFRGNPQLTGISTGSRSGDAARAVDIWTAGESIESSAAISGGTVYVGSQSKDLLAIDLETGKLTLEVPRHGLHRRILAGGVRRHRVCGRPGGVLHAVSAADGKGLWTYKTGAEIRSSPVVSGRPRADRLLRRQSILPLAGGMVSCSGSSPAAITCTGRRQSRAEWRTSPAATRSSTASAYRRPGSCAVPRGRSGGGISGDARRTGVVGNFNNEVVAADVASKRILWRYRRPAAQFPFYSSAAVAGRPHRGGRAGTKLVPLPQRQDRQGALDIPHQGPRGFVPRHSRTAACSWAQTTATSTCLLWPTRE